MPENRFGLFGQPTPEQIRQSIGRSGLETDLAIGSQSPQQALQTAGAMGGRLLTQGIAGLAGRENPDIQRVQVLQQIKAQAINSSSGLDDFIPKYAQGLYQNGFIDEAIQLLGVQQDLRKNEADIQKTQADIQKTQVDTVKSARETQSMDIKDAKTQADITNIQSQNAKRAVDIAQGWGNLDARQQEIRLQKSKFAWDKVSFNIEQAVEQYNKSQEKGYKKALIRSMDANTKKTLKELESGADGGGLDSPSKLTAGIYNAVIADKMKEFEVTSFDELVATDAGHAFLMSVAKELKPESMTNVLARMMDPGFEAELASQNLQSRRSLVGNAANPPGEVLEFDE